MEIYNTTLSSDRRKKIAAATASLALCGILVGCSETTDTIAPRNTPSSADYSADTSPTYYDDITNIAQYAQDPEIKSQLERLNDTPVAEWLYGDNADVDSTFLASLESSKQSGTIPIFVPYNIPNRDLNQASRGGLKNAKQYQDWITKVSQTIDDQPAVIVLEPDALSHLDELEQSKAEERVAILANALDIFYENNKNTAVYLDAGHSAWHDAPTAANLLKKVADKTKNGIHGIALNVSNYRPEQEIRDFAAAIEAEYGQELFVMIDNSRNGASAPVPEKEWCNPVGQKLGEADKVYDSTAKIEEAFIKTPGQSDAVCGISDVPAGEFDGELLFKQIKG